MSYEITVGIVPTQGAIHVAATPMCRPLRREGALRANVDSIMKFKDQDWQCVLTL